MVAKRVLVLYAHPDPVRSRLNRAMAASLVGVEGVTVRDLYETYPDFYVDQDAEQELVLAHDLIVFQHPLYWYSTPALLKEWQDCVLARGWAYGEGGTRLAGKDFLVATTTGAAGADGLGQYALSDLLRPIEATAGICGMRYHTPFFVQSARASDDKDIAAHAARYRTLLADYVIRGAIALEGR